MRIYNTTVAPVFFGRFAVASPGGYADLPDYYAQSPFIQSLLSKGDLSLTPPELVKVVEQAVSVVEEFAWSTEVEVSESVTTKKKARKNGKST